MLIIPFLPVSGFAATSGIWKSSDNEYSFYIQTYSEGECIVIATKAGSEFHVFLDSAVEDGIDVSEYFGKAAGLKVNFKDASNADAVLVLNGVSTNYQIGKLFEADCRSLWSGSATEGSSGIWKSDNPVDSFYTQTYSTGSAIFIETVDGIHFNVFLDDNVSDGIACQEYFGKPASLSATFQGRSQAAADMTENGATTQYSLSRRFAGDCRNVQPTPSFAPVISRAAVYTWNGFGSQMLSFSAEILDGSGGVETGASAWVIGPGNQYIPLAYNPVFGVYDDGSADLNIVTGDYTFNAEKNGLTAVPLKKTLSAAYLIEPPVLGSSGSPQVGQPLTVQWEAVSGAQGYFVFFKYEDVDSCLWKNVEHIFEAFPNVVSATIPGNLIIADADYELFVAASDKSNLEQAAAISVAGFDELTTRQPVSLQHKIITIDGDFSDWETQDRLYVDTDGSDCGNVPGRDIREVYMAKDDNFFYVRFVLNGPPDETFGYKLGAGLHINLHWWQGDRTIQYAWGRNFDINDIGYELSTVVLPDSFAAINGNQIECRFYKTDVRYWKDKESYLHAWCDQGEETVCRDTARLPEILNLGF